MCYIYLFLVVCFNRPETSPGGSLFVPCLGFRVLVLGFLSSSSRS